MQQTAAARAQEASPSFRRLEETRAVDATPQSWTLGRRPGLLAPQQLQQRRDQQSRAHCWSAHTKKALRGAVLLLQLALALRRWAGLCSLLADRYQGARGARLISCRLARDCVRPAVAAGALRPASRRHLLGGTGLSIRAAALGRTGQGVGHAARCAPAALPLRAPPTRMSRSGRPRGAAAHRPPHPLTRPPPRHAQARQGLRRRGARAS